MTHDEARKLMKSLKKPKIFKPFNPLTEYDKAIEKVVELMSRKGDIIGYTEEEIYELNKNNKEKA